MFASFQKYTTILLAAGLLSTAACNDKDNDPTPKPVEDEVTITIESPKPNAVIHAGETLHIHAVITSPVTLHGYEWKLTNKADGSVLAEADDHTHEKELTVHDHWEWEEHITSETAATLEIMVIVDHDGKTAKKSVDITLKP